MAKPYTAAMPPDTELDNDCNIEFVAIDPVTGNAVTGVTVANASIYFDNVTSGDFSSGMFTLVEPTMLHKA
jgi:hypothetical protein